MTNASAVAIRRKDSIGSPFMNFVKWGMTSKSFFDTVVPRRYDKLCRRNFGIKLANERDVELLKMLRIWQHPM